MSGKTHKRREIEVQCTNIVGDPAREGNGKQVGRFYAYSAEVSRIARAEVARLLNSIGMGLTDCWKLCFLLSPACADVVPVKDSDPELLRMTAGVCSQVAEDNYDVVRRGCGFGKQLKHMHEEVAVNNYGGGRMLVEYVAEQVERRERD